MQDRTDALASHGGIGGVTRTNRDATRARRRPTSSLAAVTALGLLLLRSKRRTRMMRTRIDLKGDSMRNRRPESMRNAYASDDGRGRSARTPSDIPARGWKDVALRVGKDFSQHRILSLAAGVTYYALL